jgi:hypothetical protein
MGGPTKLDAFELDRLDMFVTQTLLKCMIHHALLASGEPQKAARELASLYENSVHLFRLRGAEGAKEQAAREYMMDRGQALIAEAVERKSSSG